MSDLFALDGLIARLRQYVQKTLAMRPEAADLAEEVLRRGELPRGAASRVTGLSERSARDLLVALTEKCLIGSASPKSPVSMRFPATSLDALFPRLFIDPDA